MDATGTDLRAKVGGTVMKRLDLTRRLVALLTHGEIVVAGIGNANFDLFAAGPRPENFYMLGSMSLAVPIALGVALAQPTRKVFAIEGDGSLLMNLGALATVAMVAPQNLTAIVWDNGTYQITGGQTAATAEATDLVAVARGAGIVQSAWARDEAEFERLVRDGLAGRGPRFIGARVNQEPGAGRPERDPVLVKDRFMRGIGAKPAHPGPV
ncbi:MAG TPA: thiamine pyrophosphate-dependent enzyme [bacterium]|nr:thiamine pyrophosphate-dependent enzyme [bacterium]